MKEKVLLIFTLIALSFLVAACQTGAAGVANTAANTSTEATVNNVATTPPADDAPRISLAEAKADFDSGTALFIDTRPESAYKTEHIKGAINITADKLESELKELPKNKKIIAYCS